MELPEPGATFEKGEPFGVIESVKAVSDLYAPLSGEVADVNTDLADRPELVNEDPWEKGWMVAIEPSNLKGEQGELLDPTNYRNHVEASDH